MNNRKKTNDLSAAGLAAARRARDASEAEEEFEAPELVPEDAGFAFPFKRSVDPEVSRIAEALIAFSQRVRAHATPHRDKAGVNGEERGKASTNNKGDDR